jgi:hypothetical protein
MTKPSQNQMMYWTKDAFSLNHSIYIDGNIVGFIKQKKHQPIGKSFHLWKEVFV